MVQVKFEQSLYVSSLKEEAFELFYLDAYETAEDARLDPPAVLTGEILEAFKPILPIDHYTSLTRDLDLYFANVNDMNAGVYALKITGLTDAIGRTLDYDPLYFNYEYDNTVLEPYEPEPGQPIETLDRSIRQSAFIASETIRAANPDFHITGVDPDNGEIFVSPDHNSGRIMITFSSRPSSLFVNKDYITVQRKKIGFPISRWEKLNSRIKLDSTRPRVYIAIPSIETIVEELSDPNDPTSALIEVVEPAGQYEIADLDYFEPQYKYRVRISSDFGMKITT